MKDSSILGFIPFILHKWHSHLIHQHDISPLHRKVEQSIFREMGGCKNGAIQQDKNYNTDKYCNHTKIRHLSSHNGSALIRFPWFRFTTATHTVLLSGSFLDYIFYFTIRTSKAIWREGATQDFVQYIRVSPHTQDLPSMQRDERVGSQNEEEGKPREKNNRCIDVNRH